MVRRLIQQQCPGQTKPDTETGANAGPPKEVVEGILDGMSPVEREALRRCYVLGEAPESFLETPGPDTPRVSRHSSASQSRIQLQESEDQCCIILHVVLPAPEVG